MTSRWRGWRELMAVWLPALFLVAVSTIALSVYRGEFAGQAEVGGQRLERRNLELARLQERRAELEEVVGRARRSREQLAELLNVRLATERQQLTGMIAEVKDLGRRAGLQPEVIRYPEERIEDFGLRKRSMVFGVAGSYVQLRRFVNFLELSERFLTLEEVQLSEGGDGGPQLKIRLRISTLFSEESALAAGGAS